MKVCVIAEEDRLGGRICRALAESGHECPGGKVVRLDQAEGHFVRNRPEVVVAATGREVEAAVATILRLRDLTAGHLVAVGPVSDPLLVLGTLRGGAADYVDEGAVETEMAAALARLRFGRGGRAAPGRFLAVLSASGGGGASLVATNLAVAMAKTHERSLIVDLKARSGDLAAMLDLKPTHTMQDLCRVAERIDRSLFEQTLLRHTTGVSLLASPRSFEATFSAEALSRVLELGRALFPRIVADVDPVLPEGSTETLRLADVVLVVMRLEFNSLRNAKAMLDYLERRGVDPKKVAVIANRVGQPKEIAAAKIEEALGRKFLAKIPDDPKAALGSQNNGAPALTESPSSYLSKALRALAVAVDAIPVSSPNGS